VHLLDNKLFYLLQLGFHPVEVVGRLVKKRNGKRLYAKGATIHKPIQKTRVNKAGNTCTSSEYENNVKKPMSSN